MKALGGCFMSFNESKLRIQEEGFGLFLGAGASFQAGYPLMDGLTKKVFSRLPKEKVNIILDIVHQELKRSLDIERGDPNIELITDVIENRIALLSPSEERIQLLDISNEIRKHIIDTILEVKNPVLENHIKLFIALKAMFFGKPCPIWIFTTNYDLLVEIAAAIAGIPVLDGFLGTSLRYFDISSLNWKFGTYSMQGRSGRVFNPINSPYIKLLKIHGSINWWSDGQRFFSTNDQINFSANFSRIMVYPRKRKVMDILDHPFDSLWRLASEVIGSSECRYLMTIGYSYGDAHINEGLLLPKLRENKIYLSALLKYDSPLLDPFRENKNFQLGTDENTKLWDFEKFSSFMFSAAGEPILRRVR